ncbi:hypothetical protein, partial [Methanobrevibacter oralis]|uniref:hypothetical protein n=1 Tax=Methanobrevibacter oralis TaxID=66851 RepID=UPI001E652BD8
FFQIHRPIPNLLLDPIYNTFLPKCSFHDYFLIVVHWLLFFKDVFTLVPSKTLNGGFYSFANL